MFSHEEQESAKKALKKLQSERKDPAKKCPSSPEDNGPSINLSAPQLLIIGGLLSGVLEVDAFIVNKDQTVEIVLVGSLKQKTELEKVMEQVGRLPFDEVLKAIISQGL